MTEIGTQLWVGYNKNGELTEELIQPVENNLRGIGIKGKGGLWTSSYLGKEKGSDWIQWCLGNEYAIPFNSIWEGYLLEPKNDLQIYTIHTLEDMHILFDRYGYQLYPQVSELEMEGIDFEKMSEDYDGLHLTSQGEAVTRHGFSFFRDITSDLKPEWQAKKMRNFYGWDCESTFHFRWNFKSQEPIELKVEREEYEWE